MHAEPIDARANNSAPGGPGLSLWHRGRPQRPPLLRRGRRPGARDLGMVCARTALQDAGRRSPTRSSTAASLEIADWQRAVRSEVAPLRADTLAALAQLIGVDAGQLVATVTAYNAACTGDPADVRRHAPRRPRGRSHAAAAEIELGARHRGRAVPRLPADRRDRLHVRRPCDRHAGARAARRRSRFPVSMRRARSPGISIGPHRMPCRCCARSCSDGSRDARR